MIERPFPPVELRDATGPEQFQPAPELVKWLREGLFTRNQGGQTRYYGDFRPYAAVGGTREALIPTGGRRATEFRQVAEQLYDTRLRELRAMLREYQLRGVVTAGPVAPPLGEYARSYLAAKAKAGAWKPAHQSQVQKYLGEAVEFFGAEAALPDITCPRVTAFRRHVETFDSGRGGKLKPESVNKRMKALHGLFYWAMRDGLVLSNPVARDTTWADPQPTAPFPAGADEFDLDPREFRLLDCAAKRAGLSRAELVRRAAVALAEEEGRLQGRPRA